MVDSNILTDISNFLWIVFSERWIHELLTLLHIYSIYPGIGI